MKLRVSMPNSLFRVGLLLLIVKVLSSYSNIIEVSKSVDMVLSLAACLAFAGSILQKNYSTPTLLGFLLVIGLGMLTSVKTGNLTIFITIVTCVAMCREDLDETLKFMLFWEGLYVIVKMLIAAILHCMGESMMTNVGGEMKYNFGFSHPNVFACVATNLVAIYLWLKYDTLGIRPLLAISAGILVIYLMTGCRTALIVVAFLILGVMLFGKRKKPFLLMRWAAQWAVPLLAVVFYVLCSVYTSGYGIVNILDKLVSKRIKLGAYYLNRFGISFLGQDVVNFDFKWDPVWRLNSITFDNIYTYLLVAQLIWLVVIALLFWRIAKAGNNRIWLFMLSWALYGISEVHVINPYLFFVILLITELFPERNAVGEIEETADTEQRKQRGIS